MDIVVEVKIDIVTEEKVKWLGAQKDPVSE